MKKKVFLVTFILCFSLSFFALNVFNKGLWRRIYSPYAESSTIILAQNLVNISADQLIEKLHEGVKLYNVTISKGYITNGNLDTYVISNSYESYFLEFPLINKIDVNMSDVTRDIYYTTNAGDQLSSGLFYTVFPNGLKSITYHNFFKIINGEVNPFGWITVSSANDEAKTHFIQFLKDSFPGLVSVQEVSTDNTIDQTPKVEVLFISSTLFLLVLLMKISKNMKEISLRKSLGESFIKIEYDLFKSFLITVICNSVLAFIFSYAILVHTFNVFTIEYIGMLLQNFGLLIFITLLLLVFVGSILYFVSPIAVIKNRNFNKSLYNFNFIIKIVFIVFLFPEFLAYTRNLVIQSENVIAYVQSEKELLSVVQFRGINPAAISGSGGFAESMQLGAKTVAYQKEHGAMFINFAMANIPNNNYPKDGNYTGYQYVEVTVDYANYLPISIQDIINQNRNQTFVLVNKNSLKDIKFKIEEICVNCKVILTDLNFKILNYKNNSSPYIKNPVLVVYPDVTLVQSVSSESMFFMTSSPEEAEKVMFQATKDFESKIVFSNNNDVIKSIIDLAKTQLYYTFIIFMEGLFVILLVINHGVTVLYELNKKEIAIHYLSGYSFLQRSSYIVFQDILLFGLLWFYLSTNKFGILESFGYAFLVMVINLVFASLHLIRNEKKQAIDAIKNN